MSTVPNPNPSPPPVPTAGWATPEHFQAAVKQLLTLLVTLGILQTSDAGNLQSQLAACITAAFIFALNAWQVVKFLDGQVQLKGYHFDFLSGKRISLLPAALLALALLAAPAAAQCPCPCDSCGPCCTPTALLPWRSNLERQLQQQGQLIAQLKGQLDAQQHQPPAPIIVQPPAPQQTLPIAGAPLQPLPIAGSPQMLLPIEGNPHLLVPIQGSPRHQLPVAPSQPPQALPVQPSPSAPRSQPQSYTTQYAIYRPQGRNR